MTYKYGIRITNRDGSIGWIVGNDCKILLFKTKQEAVKALHLMKKDPHYSWNCEADVAEFTGYGK